MTVAAPSRRSTLGSLANVSLSVQPEAGESRRRRPSGGRGSAIGWGSRGWPSASAAADAISTLPLGVSSSRPANCITGSANSGRVPVDASSSKLSATPLWRTTSSMISRSDTCSSGSSKPIARASRRKISWLGNARPGGSTAFTCAEIVRSKYEPTMSSNSRKLAAGSTTSARSAVSVGKMSTTTVNRSSRSMARRSRRCWGFDAAMLMFQQTSARERSRSSSRSARSMWLTGSGGSPPSSVGSSSSPSSTRWSFRYRKPLPGRATFPVTAGSTDTVRTTFPPVGWRCSPCPIHSSDGPSP